MAAAAPILLNLVLIAVLGYGTLTHLDQPSIGRALSWGLVLSGLI